MQVALATLLLFIVFQLELPGQASGEKCKVLKNVMHVRWNKFGRKEWLEALHSPSRFRACLSRAYFPKKGLLHRRKKKGPNGKSDRSKHPFRVYHDDVFITRDDQQFEQLIASDDKSWALIYHCWPRGSGAHFVLLITRKRGVVDGYMLDEAKRALANTNYGTEIKWKRSGCLRPGPATVEPDIRINITIQVTMVPERIEVETIAVR